MVCSFNCYFWLFLLSEKNPHLNAGCNMLENSKLQRSFQFERQEVYFQVYHL